MPERTLADLYKTKDITEGEFEEAVVAYFGVPSDLPFRMTKGTSLSLAEAVHGNAFAFRVA